MSSYRLLLIGKERFLKDEAIAEVRGKLFRDGSEAELNFQSFEAERDAVSQFLDFLGTAPFLAEKRLAVLWGVDALEEKDRERLLADLDRLPSGACFILETQETSTRKDPFLQSLADKTVVQPCHVPFDRDLPAWIQTRATKKGLGMERALALFLMERVGRELSGLENALEELVIYIHPRRQATLDDARALIQKSSQEDVFKLADSLLDRNKKEALEIADSLARSGVRAPEIVGVLAGQLERYKKALTALAEGKSRADLADELRVPKMHRSAFFLRLEKIPAQRLRKLQRELLACDESFKTGRSQERFSVERFILSS